MLDVTRLRVLLAVARTGSVTAAARDLDYAQPSVSHHLTRLEAEVGTRLTQRAGRGIRLTDAGRLLAERAEEILGRLDAAEAEVAAHVGLRAGRVRLAAFPSALGTFVPHALAAFHAEHPAVEVSLVETEPPEATGMLRAGDVDVALVFAYGDAPDDPALRHTPLLEEPWFLVTGPDGSGRTLVDHAGDRWIAGCERCRAHLLDRCRAAGVAPQIAFTTDDAVAAQALVVSGLGVTALPALALLAHRHPAARVVALPGAGRRVSAAVYGAPPDQPATAALLRHLALAAAAVDPAAIDAVPVADATGAAAATDRIAATTTERRAAAHRRTRRA